MKFQVLVATGISHHRVAAPPRLVRISIPDHAKGQASRSISAMRSVAAAAAASLLIWAVLLDLVV